MKQYKSGLVDTMNEDNLMLDELSALYDADLTAHSSLDAEALLNSLPLRDDQRYNREELIAKGGMKQVLKVFDTHTGRYIALATLLPESTKDQYAPFIREARLTAALDHPNIITIHDIGIDESNEPYFTMELKVGQSLAEMINDKCLILNDRSSSKNKGQRITSSDARNLLEIFLKICDAVAYAHSKNILHLDLKPDNIQVGAFGEVVVCDWGLGKMIGDMASDAEADDNQILYSDLLFNMTLSGQIKGTPGFMAPEQVRADDPKTVQTDIYALGAILYYILCGEATTSGTLEEMLDQTLEGAITQPITNNSNIPESLNAVCMKALSGKQEERYGSVDELKMEIQSFLMGYATTAENAGVFTECSLFYRRNKQLCLLAAGCFIIIFVLTSFFVYNLNKSRLAAEEASQKSVTMRLRAEAALSMYEKEKDRLIESNKKSLEDLDLVV